MLWYKQSLALIYNNNAFSRKTVHHTAPRLPCAIIISVHLPGPGYLIGLKWLPSLSLVTSGRPACIIPRVVCRFFHETLHEFGVSRDHRSCHVATTLSVLFYVETEVEIVEEPELAAPVLLQPGLLGVGVGWVWVPGPHVARLGFRRYKRSQDATTFLSVFSFVNTEVQTMEEAELVAKASFEPFLLGGGVWWEFGDDPAGEMAV
jgi:hypothetical protein